MVKKSLFLIFFFCFSHWIFAGNTTSPVGIIINQPISDSTTALSWTYVKGSSIIDTVYNSDGNKFVPAAFNISVTDRTANTYDFNYAYSNSPSAYFTWWESSKGWGPLQADMNFPTNGLWISPLPSYGALSVTLQAESR